MKSQVITIVGMGAGNGMGIARRFGKEGFVVAMIARSGDKLKKYQKSLQKDKIESYYFLADVSDPQSLRDSISYIYESLGPTHVLVYNAAVPRQKPPLSLAEQELLDDFEINVVGAMTAIQAVVPAMKEEGAGKVLITGGGFALEPNPALASLSLGKSALRNLTFALHDHLLPHEIHVATVTICGNISPDHEKYAPDAISENYWTLYQQERDAWEKEIVY